MNRFEKLDKIKKKEKSIKIAEQKDQNIEYNNKIYYYDYLLDEKNENII